VVDEFGGTAGLLTLADVLTEMIGHVGDEFRSGQPATETLPDGRVRLPGGLGVEDAALLLRATWDTGASTVGGMVTEALGHIPAVGETTTVGDFEFLVERVTNRIPESVTARRVVPAPSEDAP
jgi:CBS domain containing-hemolysin-like protein